MDEKMLKISEARLKMLEECNSDTGHGLNDRENEELKYLHTILGLHERMKRLHEELKHLMLPTDDNLLATRKMLALQKERYWGMIKMDDEG